MRRSEGVFVHGGERERAGRVRRGPGAFDLPALRAALGFAASVVLYGLFVWSPASLFSFSRDAVFRYAGYAASVAFGLALLLAPVALSAVRRRSRRRMRVAATAAPAFLAQPAALRVLPGACAALPALCACLWAAVFAAGSPQDAPGPLYLAAVVSAVALAAVHLWWVDSLARRGAAIARRVLVLTACASGAVNLAVSVAPEVAVRAVAFALAVCDAALVAVDVRCRASARGPAPAALEGSSAALRPARGAVPTAPGAEGTVGWREHVAALAPIAVAAVVVTLVAPLVNTVLMVDALDPALRIGLGGCMDFAAGVALLALWTLPRRAPSAFAVLLGYIALFFVALLLVWVAGLQAQEVLLALGSAGFFLATYLLADAAVEAQRGGGSRAVASFGVCCGVFMLARVVSDMFSEGLLNAGIAEETKVLMTMFLLVYLFTCAAFLLFGAIARRRRTVVADAPSGPVVRPRAATPADPAAALPSVASDPLVPGASEKTPSAEDDAAAAVRWETLALHCRQIAGTFGLSQREREVLGLMMQGRNVPAIASELVLSRNTVQTHVRHLYERLGVHSRQELVAFVEAFDGGKTLL